MALPEYAAQQRLKALERLSKVTREKWDAERSAALVEGTAAFSTEVFVKACRRLEMQSQWFPKGAELMDECRNVARQIEATKAQRRELAEPPVSAERVAEFRQRVQDALRRKGMR